MRFLLPAACLVVTLGLQPLRVGTALVVVPIIATGRAGQTTADLTAADFTIFEDRVQQTIATFTHDRQPVSVSLLLDGSVSMAGLPKRFVPQIVTRVVDGLDDRDEVALTVFADHAETPIGWTPVRRFPRIDWNGWKSTPYSALFDGLTSALGQIERASHRRGVVLVISDGGENASKVTLQSLAKTMRQSETTVYSVRTLPPSTSGLESNPPADPSLTSGLAVPPAPLSGGAMRRTLDPLNDLVNDSGGLALVVESPADIGRAVDAFLDDLRHQYIVGYAPAKPLDGSFRRIRVETRAPVRLRYRRGYLAAAAPPAP